MSQVLNTEICSFPSFSNPGWRMPPSEETLASLLEQILLFDKVVITTDLHNSSLIFLIRHLGLKETTTLLEMGYIKFIIPPAQVFYFKENDGEYNDIKNFRCDRIEPEVLDPESNVFKALCSVPITFEKDFIKYFIKLAAQNYISPDGGKIAHSSEKIILNAFKNGTLTNFGISNEDSNKLDEYKSEIFTDLAFKVIESSILAVYEIKSYNDQTNIKLFDKCLSNIGNALQVTKNATEIFRIENVPNLKKLFQTEKISFDNLLELKESSVAVYFRKWINSISENANCDEMTCEYINTIKGKGKFFESTRGKFAKTITSFGVSAGLGGVIAGTTGALIGSILQPAADLGLGLLENFWVDNLLKGKNPSMFIDEVRQDIKNEDS